MGKTSDYFRSSHRFQNISGFKLNESGQDLIIKRPGDSSTGSKGTGATGGSDGRDPGSKGNMSQTHSGSFGPGFGSFNREGGSQSPSKDISPTRGSPGPRRLPSQSPPRELALQHSVSQPDLEILPTLLRETQSMLDLVCDVKKSPSKQPPVSPPIVVRGPGSVPQTPSPSKLKTFGAFSPSPQRKMSNSISPSRAKTGKSPSRVGSKGADGPHHNTSIISHKSLTSKMLEAGDSTLDAGLSGGISSMLDGGISKMDAIDGGRSLEGGPSMNFSELDGGPSMDHLDSALLPGNSMHNFSDVAISPVGDVSTDNFLSGMCSGIRDARRGSKGSQGSGHGSAGSGQRASQAQQPFGSKTFANGFNSLLHSIHSPTIFNTATGSGLNFRVKGQPELPAQQGLNGKKNSYGDRLNQGVRGERLSMGIRARASSQGSFQTGSSGRKGSHNSNYFSRCMSTGSNQRFSNPNTMANGQLRRAESQPSFGGANSPTRDLAGAHSMLRDLGIAQQTLSRELNLSSAQFEKVVLDTWPKKRIERGTMTR